MRAEAPLPRGVKVKIRHTDAREAVEAAPDASYELIVTDVYAGARVPAHVTSTEFLHESRRVLRASTVGSGTHENASSRAFHPRAQLPTPRRAVDKWPAVRAE